MSASASASALASAPAPGSASASSSASAPLQSGLLGRDDIVFQACVRLAGFLGRARDEHGEPIAATYIDLRMKWWEKARVSHHLYGHLHQHDVRLWPRFFEHQTSIPAHDLELVCHHVFDVEMRALRAESEKKKRFERAASLLGKGTYFLFVLLGPPVCGSVASLKKISATLSPSALPTPTPDQVVEQIWAACLERHGTSIDSPPMPSVGDVTTAVSRLRPNGPSSRASSVATARRTPTPAPPVMTTVAGRGRGKRAAAAAAADHLQPEAARRAAKRARPSLRRAEGDDEDEGDDDGDDDDDDDFSVFEETERPRAAPSAASSPGSTLLRVESTQAEGVGGGASPGEQAKGHESVETERLELLRRLAALPPMPGVEALWGHFAGMAGSFADMINHD